MTNAPPSFPSQEAANAPPAGALVTLRALLFLVAKRALLSLVAKRGLLSLVAKGALFPLLRSSPLTYHQDNESPCLLHVSPARHLVCLSRWMLLAETGTLLAGVAQWWVAPAGSAAQQCALRHMLDAL